MEKKKAKNLKTPKKLEKPKIVTTEREVVENIEQLKKEAKANNSNSATFETVAELDDSEKYEKHLRELMPTLKPKELNAFVLDQLRHISICEKHIKESDDDNYELNESLNLAAEQDLKQDAEIDPEDYEDKDYEDKDFETKNSTKKELLEGLNDNNIVIEHSLKGLKQIICPFHKAGSYPKCKTCIQEKEIVLECTQNFKQIQAINPTTFWTVAAKTPLIREKVSISNLLNGKNLTKTVGLRCNQCYISNSCPEFLVNATCSIDFSPELDITSPVKIIEFIVKLQAERVGRATTIEVVDGGVPDQILSQEIDRLKNLAAALKDMNHVNSSRSASITIKESNSASNLTTSTTSEKVVEKPSLLAALFGGGLSLNNNTNNSNTNSKEIQEVKKETEFTDYLEIGSNNNNK